MATLRFSPLRYRQLRLVHAAASSYSRIATKRPRVRTVVHIVVAEWTTWVFGGAQCASKTNLTFIAYQVSLGRLVTTTRTTSKDQGIEQRRRP